MAEKIVSPGVFTRERDLSFLPAGITQIGAAIVGPTVKGPAFEPVIIESFKEFEAVFGPKTLDSYVPYTVEAYLKSAGRVTVVRTLGLTGYKPKMISVKVAGGTGSAASLLISFSGVPAVDETITIIDAAGLSKTYTAKGADNISGGQFQQSSGADTVVDTLQQVIEHANGHNGSLTVTQPSSTSILITNASAGSAGNTAVTNDLANATVPAAFTGGNDVGTVADEVFAVLHPTQVDPDATFTPSLVTATSQIDLKLTADSYASDTNFTTGKTLPFTYSASIDTTAGNWLGKVLGFTPKSRIDPVYNYMLFDNYASRSFSEDSTLTTSVSNIEDDFEFAYASKNGYEARTPFIVSQNLGSYAAPKTTRLFKFHTRSHGTTCNYQYKVAISNVKAPSAVAGSDYGTFSIAIRRVDLDGTIHSSNTPYAKSTDKDLRPHIVEQYNNVTLDPNSPNFIARVIGDRYQEIDANGKVTVYGDYPNLSNHVWVEVPEEVKDQGISPDLVPFGFEALKEPLHNSHGNLPTASFVGHTNAEVQRGVTSTHFVKKSQLADNVYNKNIHYGFDYLDTDNYNYLLPLSDDSQVGNNKHFNLSHCVQHPSASLAAGATVTITPDGSTINLSTKKFIVPFQGGFDGLNPARYIARSGDITANNMLGFDLSTAEKDGSKAFKRAINAVSNPDEYDINLLVTPGANHRLHSVVTTHAKNTCENRGDALYIMDAVGYDTTTISTVTNTVKALDSNYAATYWPWVKILDTDKNRPVWVPPSTVMAGVISKNDQVAFEWFAPAGLNRGILTEAIDVPTRLTHAERDDLYEGRVNPIATFKEGICIWGQKTLQAKPSALDRINVRRLLIAAKKFIASATKFLVFENNTSATRQRFLNIANPYFESVQQRQGLHAYKVIMDATNNTPDVIDRNQMIGEIFLQPAKSAEFIILDFNILPTGAVFPE
jgi:phage tail sheath protein FI